jgi:hypothetical protein
MALVRRSLGLFGLLLVAATWRLWTPQTVFPQVPAFGAAGPWPGWIQWLGLAGMLAGLSGALVAAAGRWATASLVLFAASTAGMIALDQMRLQPWAYQYVLMALVLAVAEPRGAVGLLRLLLVGFYFHSALTKLDYAFLHTLGQQFLASLLGLGGLSVESWSEPARLAAAAVFPVGELLVAVALFFARSRRIGLAGAVVLHLVLLVILGPWGLDHQPGVLVWNVAFIVQDVLLFWFVSSRETTAEPAAQTVPAPWPASAMIGAALLLPFLAPTSWWDMWPSWGLYAASAQRVTLEVHRLEQEQLSAPLADWLEPPEDPSNPWLTLRLDRWALDALGAPIYPQSRVQLGVARGVAERFALGHRARAIRFDQAARFSGKRRFTVFHGPAQWEAAADEYWLNTRPRRNLE